MTMISVIIPLYNKAHTIEKTLDCVLSQTYRDYEVVIVDDGSNDNGVQLINEKYQDPRIRIISQRNQGVSAARNTGIENARGEWLSFLDADDLWDDRYLEYVNEAIIKLPESKYILGGRTVLNVTDGSSFNFIPAALYGRTEKIDFFQNPHIFAHISASTINRKFIEDNALKFIPGQKFHEDFTFIFQVALLTQTAYIGLPLVTYCGGVPGQATSNLNSNVRLIDGCLFRNTVMSRWLQSELRNGLFPVFMKYETRHILMSGLRSGNMQYVKDLLNGLSDEYKSTLFHKVELRLYKCSYARIISINWIRLTKLIWRMHGYPRVGAS